MLTVTFSLRYISQIRHGESEDNLKNIWAGWKDAPLSPLGQSQAAAIGSYFSQTSTSFTHIYASPLLRAHSTGLAIHKLQPHSPPFTVTPLLREQHFGVAEGNPWALRVPEGETTQSMIAKGVYPVPRTRADRFEGGESLDDLAARAEEAVRECVLPHLGASADNDEGLHVALASHGLCISECVQALLRLDPKADHEESYTGLLNTAWTRLVVERRDADYEVGFDVQEGTDALRVRVTDVNRSEHLEGIVALTEPVSQSEARAFFGGKAGPVSDNTAPMNAHI
ncbi:hypothetical protein H0H92_001162 [Tricholoma furcatifolium]|nr:hypothetical protein H0H92_001162 [Tricholoma furcatifolium]